VEIQADESTLAKKRGWQFIASRLTMYGELFQILKR
jgi:hypothetical protein